MEFEPIPTGSVGVLDLPERPSAAPAHPAATPVVPPIEEATDEAPRVSLIDGSTFPKRYWTAGPGSPQEKIWRGVNKPKLSPVYYYYLVNDREEEQLLLTHMQGRVWVEDLHPDEKDEVCTKDGCSFHCRSRAALLMHYQLNHPTGQSIPPLY